MALATNVFQLVIPLIVTVTLVHCEVKERFAANKP